MDTTKYYAGGGKNGGKSPLATKKAMLGIMRSAQTNSVCTWYGGGSGETEWKKLSRFIPQRPEET